MSLSTSLSGGYALVRRCIVKMYCADIGGQSRLGPMRPIRVAVAILFVGAAPAAAVQQPVSLHTKPFVLSADTTAKKVNVGVSADGTGHFAWDVNNTAGDDPFVYCRVPRGQRKCASTQPFPLPLESFGEPQVLVAASYVVLVTHRCCGHGEGTYAIVS